MCTLVLGLGRFLVQSMGTSGGVREGSVIGSRFGSHSDETKGLSFLSKVDKNMKTIRHGVLFVKSNVTRRNEF